MFQRYIIWLLLGSVTPAFAQQITGKIQDKKSKEPVIGATIRVVDTKNQATVTDLLGEFSLQVPTLPTKLVISAVGYQTDTVQIASSPVQIELQESSETLDQVVVRSSATAIDRLSPIQTQIITSKELAKAACCNLSESFETNASVSVSYTDAVTGAKQIQMLGLAGTYVQTNVENIPSIRGLASTFGLNYIPGTWIQSIDVAKGVGSVLTGYESISGGLNVELQKPDASDRLFVNTYVNNWGRGELNVHWSKKISDKWSVGVLSHGSFLAGSVDRNEDTFLDLPKYNQVNVLNRWKYQSDRWMAQFGVKVLKESRLGGQSGFVNRQETPRLYGFSNDTRRMEGFTKIARLYPEKPYKGLALIASAVNHESSSWVGTRFYDASQSSAYMNLIYQNIIGDTRHTYKMGTSLQVDNFDESLGDILLQRQEIVPGAFVEYSYVEPEKLTVVIGNRLDYHSLFGLQYTPRIHVKKQLTNHIDWRASFGRGFRVANPLAENIGYLLSARKVEFRTAIQPEIAWNMGTSLAAEHGPISWMLDVYHTRFVQQQIVDAEHPGHLYFYNSQDLSYATAAQIELLWKATERIELKSAYRYFDVKQTMTGMGGTPQLLEKMMVNKHRVLVNAAYALPYNKWKVDATLHVNGSTRLPYLAGEVVDPNQEKRSPAFINVNTQVTRTFPRWEVYLGAENLTNYRQPNPILQFNRPFDSGFDAGIVWGPIVGRTVYTGMRWKM